MAGIAPATDVGTLSQIVSNAGLTKQTINILTEQTSTGLISTQFEGLGAGARIAIDLSVQLAQNTTLQANTDSAANIQQASQTALGRIQSIVASFTPQLLAAQTTGTSSLPALSVTARDSLNQVASLLDTKVGDIYIFAGQDSHTAPIPSPDSIGQSAFFAAIQSAVATLSTSGAAGVATQTLTASAAGATSPFSASLEASNAPATVDLGDGATIQVGILADQNSDAVSSGTGTTSTGSYTRDILRGLATIAALTPAQATDPQIGALLQGTLQSLQGADSALNTDIGALGVRQTRVSSAKSDFADTATALTAQQAGVQEVNLASVSTKLANATTQLQASFQLLAALEQLTLAKFLPA